MVDLIFRTERTVAGVQETHAQSFMLIRHVVQIDVETFHWDPCHRVRATRVHVEDGGPKLFPGRRVISEMMCMGSP